MTLRVLHCIPTMGGGGSERQLTHLASEQVRQGLSIHVISGQGGSNLERLRESGAAVHMLPNRGNHDPRRFSDLRSVIRELRPDLVQTWLLQMDVLGGLAAWMLRIPWMLTERSSEGTFHPAPKFWIRRLVASTAAAFVSNSEGGDRYWRRRLPGKPGWIVPNIVPFEEIDQAAPIDRRSVGIDPSARIVLVVGRLSVQKNLRPLFSAVLELATRIPIYAFILGEGPEWDSLQAMLRAADPAGRIRLLGFRSDVWNWMKLADLLVSPSLVEGQPNSILEAMAAGCPIVASDIPAHRELLDDSCAILVEPGSKASIADGIERVLQDPSLARSRAQVARRRIEMFSASRAAARYAEIYRDLLERRKPLPAASRGDVRDRPHPS